jgi:hypothetical protein
VKFRVVLVEAQRPSKEADEEWRMSRDKYIVDLQCPKCKAQGVAHVSEDDSGTQGDMAFTIQSVSDGFRLVAVDRDRATMLIECSCGQQFSPNW